MVWISKVLSWFQEEQSAFLQLPIRRITLSDHPDNIAVFEAVSLFEACLKADAAMRLDGIQGAVWVRNEAKPFLEDKLAAIRKLREQSQIAAFDHQAMQATNGINLKTTLVAGDNGEPLPHFENVQGLAAEDVIEPQRLSDLLQLSRVFGTCSLSSRYEMLETTDPHYDHYSRFAMRDSQEDRFFLGRMVRILVSRDQPSIVVYDTKGGNPPCEEGGYIRGNGQEALKAAWQPSVGDYLFSCDLTWGTEKALPHSSPEFSCEREEDCRVLDVFDVSDGQAINPDLKFDSAPEA
ncbi:MAG: hypothetical protein H6858_05890 [Rhodospirillales bacterium]|nr:hypothetical protein [Alphaproteobacteria bacterium]MCB9977107.1 hypothetical protein [Rhodospirillales bacterium]